MINLFSIRLLHIFRLFPCNNLFYLYYYSKNKFIFTVLINIY